MDRSIGRQDRVRLVDRAIGCMMGLAVGDAMGDLGRSDPHRQRHGIITNLYDGAKSTDDTEFAVLTAQTLLDCGGQLTLDHLVASWKKYILDQGGMGARGGKPLYGAVANLARGLLPPYTGIDNTHNDDDGAVMRIAPVGIVCAGNPERAAQLAEIDACMSHARDGIWGAQAMGSRRGPGDGRRVCRGDPVRRDQVYPPGTGHNLSLKGKRKTGTATGW